MLTGLDNLPINRELRLVTSLRDAWKMWISGPRNNDRPTEEAAFRNLRDKAMVAAALDQGFSVDMILSHD